MCATVYGWRHLVKATEITAGLAESNGSLPPGGWLKVICGLTACTPDPTLCNEYGKTFPFTFLPLTYTIKAQVKLSVPAFTPPPQLHHNFAGVMPNMSHCQITRTYDIYLTITLQLTLTLTEEINKHLRTRLCEIAHAQWRGCELFGTASYLILQLV